MSESAIASGNPSGIELKRRIVTYDVRLKFKKANLHNKNCDGNNEELDEIVKLRNVERLAIYDIFFDAKANKKDDEYNDRDSCAAINNSERKT